MGAGARMAAERDRWPAHWRVADLELEQDCLLELLQDAEELRAVVPGIRSTSDGDAQILVGVTDRRVVVVGRRDGHTLHVTDVTDCATAAPRTTAVPYSDGTWAFDLDADSAARVWATIDSVVPASIG
jgi:hypothetical protein